MRHSFLAPAVAVLGVACAHPSGEARECPPGVLRAAAPGSFEEQELTRLSERPLCPASGEAYRLIVAPPLRAPWSVRAERSPRGWHIEAKEFWGMPLHREHEVLAGELDAALADLTASGFWGASPPKAIHSSKDIDPSVWIIEGVLDGKYRFVHLDGPDFDPDQPEQNHTFRRAAIELLRVGGIDAEIAKTF